jgi:hypothetical protein
MRTSLLVTTFMVANSILFNAKKLDIDTKCLLQLCANMEEFFMNSFFDETMVPTQNKTIKYERRS